MPRHGSEAAPAQCHRAGSAQPPWPAQTPVNTENPRKGTAGTGGRRAASLHVPMRCGWEPPPSAQPGNWNRGGGGSTGPGSFTLLADRVKPPRHYSLLYVQHYNMRFFNKGGRERGRSSVNARATLPAVALTPSPLLAAGAALGLQIMLILAREERLVLGTPDCRDLCHHRNSTKKKKGKKSQEYSLGSDFCFQAFQ